MNNGKKIILVQRINWRKEGQKANVTNENQIEEAGQQIYEAVKKEDVQLLIKLLDSWAGNQRVLNWYGKDKLTPLMYACRFKKKNADLLKELLRTPGIDVNLTIISEVNDSNGEKITYEESALIWALQEENITALEILNRTKKDTRLVIKEDVFKKMYGDNYKEDMPIEILDEFFPTTTSIPIRPEPEKNPGQAIYEAANNGKVDILKKLLIEYAENSEVLNYSPSQGMTPLIIACGVNEVECVRLLVDTVGVDVNLFRVDGSTALCCAVQSEFIEVVKVLLEAKKDGKINLDLDKAPTAKWYSSNFIGKSPLKIARELGYTAIVDGLVAAGATEKEDPVPAPKNSFIGRVGKFFSRQSPVKGGKTKKSKKSTKKTKKPKTSSKLRNTSKHLNIRR